MKYTPLFCITLLCSAMTYPMQKAPKEIIQYNIANKLDRIDKIVLKMTCLHLYAIVESQDTLNKKLENAYKINNITKITMLRNLGALLPHEELLNSIPDSPTLGLKLAKKYLSSLTPEQKNEALNCAKKYDKKNIIEYIESKKSNYCSIYYEYPGAQKIYNPHHDTIPNIKIWA